MHWSHERGIAAERLVAEELSKRGYRLVKQRFRTPMAEVDLLMKSLSEYLLVEVKTLSERGFPEYRLTRRQKDRLARARTWVEDKTRQDVRLVMAWVDPKGKILLFNLTADELR